MRISRAIALAAFLSIFGARSAFADLTGFVGANTTPANRQTLGASLGINILMVGFEFEYAVTTDDMTAGAPSLKTGMANVLLQTPAPLAGFQPYVTVGGGLYNETLADHSDTSFGSNFGGGVKVSLAGPIALRVDYRLFKLGSGALYSPAHRIYAGLDLKF
jgi:opacity protein-like surface antigen